MRRARNFGAGRLGHFPLAELSYITYHAGLTQFLFAHTIAEVLDALALVTIAVGLPLRSQGT